MGDSTRIYNVLLVEDHVADQKLTERAFQGLVQTHLHIAIDGIEAMDFLLQKGRFTESPRPDLVLLDLNMPRKDGWEVLQEIRGMKVLEALPVVILTTSAAADDVSRAFRLQANSYVVKPVSFDQFRASIEAIHHYWFKVSLVP
jgi:CheY-like chemotaxis protein